MLPEGNGKLDLYEFIIEDIANVYANGNNESKLMTSPNTSRNAKNIKKTKKINTKKNQIKTIVI